MSRRTSFVLICIAFAMMLAHRKDDEEESRPAETKAPPASFAILAGSELKDMESLAKGSGLGLRFSYDGTLNAVDRIAAGERFDALWLAQGKYLATNVLAQEKTMLSPVVLGLKTSKAHELGWDAADPTWKDIAEAAKAGKFTFGMTNPASSNSGLTAIIGLASALAANPDALTAADVNTSQLQDFFKSQSLTAGSSGALAEAYESNPARVDGIINYESVLLSLNARGRLAEPLTLVYPKEGIITADYPLMLLNAAKRADYDKLVAYLRGKDVQSRISALTLRRPINPDAVMAAAIPKRTLIEIPFPGQPALISALLDSFLSDVRIPGASRYVLDLSSSMQGARMESLKRAMLMLASQTPHGDERFARFLNREEVGIITFSSQPAPTVLFPMGSDMLANEKARAAVAHFIEPLHAEQSTAIYSSVKQALSELEQERVTDHEKRYYTVVLMTDGENNRGLSHSEFDDWYKEQGDKVRGIPVFPILFGEGDERELRELAGLTGGKVFDSRSTDLPVVFKEIRGYQ
jgi:Ca-activated chloride channel family protein